MHIEPIPLLNDNYAYLLTSDEAVGQAAIVDPTLHAPILELLDQRDLRLTRIINTHHHWDHTDGNILLVEATGAQVSGYERDVGRIPCMTDPVSEAVPFEVFGSIVEVIPTPGHTHGHMALYFKEEGILLTGDCLFVMGCGRLFEGTPEQMYVSLQRLMALPDETLIYPGHNYSAANARFAMTVEPDNVAIASGLEEAERFDRHGQFYFSTVAKEKATNPFVRARDAQEFARIRALKDKA